MNVERTVEEGSIDISVAELHEQLQGAITDASWFIEQCAIDFETRNCLWAGQSDDGRKHAADIGNEKDVFPWEGASDVRIRLADEIINDNVRLHLGAIKRMSLQAAPVESTDTSASAAYSTFLRWLTVNKMAENIRREVRLLSNWQEHYCASILAVTWDQEIRIKKVPVTLEQLQASILSLQEAAEKSQDPTAMKTADAAAEMFNRVFDAAADNETSEWIRGMYPDMTKRQARSAVDRLRTEGGFLAPERYVVRSQPLWTACKIFRDIFFPANTADLQRAPWIQWREVLTPVDLRSRVITDDYDEELVEEAIANHTGKTVLDAVKFDSKRAQASVVDEMDGLVEVFRAFRKVIDEDGFPDIQVKIYVPGMDEPLSEYMMDYRHGEYCFIEFCRDRTERLILENRSVPALCDTQQTEVKIHRDFRADRASITILPPVRVPMLRADKRLLFGPAVQVPERRTGEVDFMKLQPLDRDTVNIEEQVREDVNNYFARLDDKVNQARQTLYAQAATDDFLGGLTHAMKQTLCLCRQNYKNELFLRVTGVPLPFELGEDEPAGTDDFDIMLDFNAADLNMEYVLKKIDAINKAVLPADTFGVIDRAKLVEWAMRSIDPVLAPQLVQSLEAATNREIEDEQVNFAKIMAGTEPEKKAEGQNFALRLRVLQAIVQANPDIQRDLANKPMSQEMLDRRLQHLQFQVQQQQNAQIGRMGALPGLELGGMGQMSNSDMSRAGV